MGASVGSFPLFLELAMFHFIVRMRDCVEREIFIKAKDGVSAMKKAEAMAISAKWGEDPIAVSVTKCSGKKSFLSI